MAVLAIVSQSVYCGGGGRISSLDVSMSIHSRHSTFSNNSRIHYKKRARLPKEAISNTRAM